MYFFDLVIFANAIFIALERNDAEVLFLALFNLEILLKLYTYGFKGFFTRYWNMLVFFSFFFFAVAVVVVVAAVAVVFVVVAASVEVPIAVVVVVVVTVPFNCCCSSDEISLSMCSISEPTFLFFRFDFLVIVSATLALIIETSYQSCEWYFCVLIVAIVYRHTVV